MKLSHILETILRQKTKYGPDIHVEQAPYGKEWMAVDNNLYDGAPDAGPQAMGHGITKNSAVLDLMDQLEEMGHYDQGTLERTMQELFPEPKRENF